MTGFAEFAVDTEQGGELLDLLPVGGGHQPEAGAERVEPVENGVEADVFLGREIQVETRVLKDDADLAADIGRGGRQIVAGDADLPTGAGEGGGQDRDDRRLTGAVRTEQGEELARGDGEGDAVDGVCLGPFIALGEIPHLDDRGRSWHRPSRLTHRRA